MSFEAVSLRNALRKLKSNLHSVFGVFEDIITELHFVDRLVERFVAVDDRDNLLDRLGRNIPARQVFIDDPVGVFVSVVAVGCLSSDVAEQSREYERVALHDLVDVELPLNDLKNFQNMLIEIILFEVFKLLQEERNQMEVVAHLYEPVRTMGKSFHDFATPTLLRDLSHSVGMFVKERTYVALGLPEQIHFKLRREA